MKSLSLSQPHVIIMVGLPGSGKSFFAEQFADTFHAPYLSLTRITRFEGVSADTANHLLHYQLDELLKTHQSLIVDGTANTRFERMELTKKARAAGYETLFIWVQTDPATAKQRATKETKGKPSPVLSVEEYDRQVKRFVAPNAIEQSIVISGKHTYATQAKIVLKRLSAPRAEISMHVAAPIRAEQPSGRRNITVR